jgi:hypothetical protein
VEEQGLRSARSKAAKQSGQAVYLHFTNRADLLVKLVRYSDEKRQLAEAIRKVSEALHGVAAIRQAVALQGRMNPGIRRLHGLLTLFGAWTPTSNVPGRTGSRIASGVVSVRWATPTRC